MLVFKPPLCYLVMAPKHMSSSDAGHSDMPKRSPKVLPLSETVKVIDLIREKRCLLRWLKIYGKNKSSIHEIS